MANEHSHSIEKAILDNRGANVLDIAEIAGVPVGKVHHYLFRSPRGRDLANRCYVARNPWGRPPNWYSSFMPVRERSLTPAYELPVAPGTSMVLTRQIRSLNHLNEEIARRTNRLGRTFLKRLVRTHSEMVAMIQQRDILIAQGGAKVHKLEGENMRLRQVVREFETALERGGEAVRRGKLLLLKTKPVKV
jgi:hypothetical protein